MTKETRVNPPVEALDPVSKCQIIKAKLDGRGVGYGSQDSYSMLVTPDSLLICNQDANLIRKKGTWIYHWLKMSNELYLSGINHYQHHWVTKLVEANLFPEVVQYQRRFAQKRELPLFARADLTEIWSCVEAQLRIGGWGYMTAVPDVMKKISPPQNGEKLITASLDEGFARGVRLRLAGEPRRVVLLSPENYSGESAYFASRLRERQGLNCEVVPIDNWESGIEGADIIYRRELNLAMLASCPAGRQLIEKNLRGEVVIEPPLNLIFDQKLAMILPFHPKTREVFNQQHRSLLMPTHLVDHNLQPPAWIHGEFVYKYAGSYLKNTFGSRQVWREPSSSHTRWQSIQKCHRTLEMENEAWIAQPYRSPKFPVRVYDEESSGIKTREMHARIMPIYMRNPLNQQTGLIGITANFREHWKVRGAPDAALTDVRIIEK